MIEENEQQWYQLINDWIELGNCENQFESEEDSIFSSTEWNHDFSLAGCTIHPSDDEKAKWSLNALFVDDLESPLFLGTDHIFTNAQ